MRPAEAPHELSVVMGYLPVVVAEALPLDEGLADAVPLGEVQDNVMLAIDSVVVTVEVSSSEAEADAEPEAEAESEAEAEADAEADSEEEDGAESEVDIDCALTVAARKHANSSMASDWKVRKIMVSGKRPKFLQVERKY